MATGAIVKGFNEEEDVRHGILTGSINSMIHQLCFKCSEETLYRGVVVAIPPSTHAWHDVVDGQQILESLAGVLAATIIVMNQWSLWLLTTQSHQQRRADQLLLHSLVHGPTDNASREQVKNHRQIEPSFLCGNVGDIGTPFGIRAFRCKITVQQIRRQLMVWIGFGRSLIAFCLLGHKTLLAHQATHPMLTTENDANLQIMPDALIAICLVTILEKLLDLFHVYCVGHPRYPSRGGDSSRGAVLFPAYERVGPAGKVIGIDLSSKMVAQTQKEVGSRGLETILVNQMDAEDLQFPAETFDFVLCGLALFFFPDAQRTLMEIHRVLKPGGVFCTTTFGDDDSRWDVFGETIKTYKDKLKPVPQSDALSFNNDKEIVETLTEAGFKKIEIFSEDKEFHYADPDEWWASMWSHGMRALLERMGEETLEDFKKDCYNVVQRMAGEKGIPQLLRVLITRASRPAESDQIRI